MVSREVGAVGAGRQRSHGVAAEARVAGGGVSGLGGAVVEPAAVFFEWCLGVALMAEVLLVVAGVCVAGWCGALVVVLAVSSWCSSW